MQPYFFLLVSRFSFLLSFYASLLLVSNSLPDNIFMDIFYWNFVTP